MSISIQPQSLKEKFIMIMNDIITVRDKKSTSICVKTKHNDVGCYIQLTEYINFLSSDSDSIGPIKIEDITSIGYKPKNKNYLFYIDLQ